MDTEPPNDSFSDRKDWLRMNRYNRYNLQLNCHVMSHFERIKEGFRLFVWNSSVDSPGNQLA